MFGSGNVGVSGLGFTNPVATGECWVCVSVWVVVV